MAVIEKIALIKREIRALRRQLTRIVGVEYSHSEVSSTVIALEGGTPPSPPVPPKSRRWRPSGRAAAVAPNSGGGASPLTSGVCSFHVHVSM